MAHVFKQAIAVYVENDIKIADAVMGYWGPGKGGSEVFTFDEKYFKRIEGLKARRTA
ncbi:MAG: hypothetical protein M0024_02190 [Nitrospiraceae bacterium]|nr:hypothetical protein [Nitrospiraceae bacterium]